MTTGTEKAADGLSERERRVLSLTVLCHVSSGEPVGSRFLCRRLDLDLSPATIRNTMADLEDKGYLRQPHASSGRIPTDLGYRFYVEEVVSGRAAPGPGDVSGALGRARTDGGVTGLVREASRLLSTLTRNAGVVLGPVLGDDRCRRLEFRRVGERRVLAIVLAGSGLVRTRLLEMEEDWRQDELDAMARLWNERFADRPLREVRDELRVVLAAERAELGSLLVQALELGRLALAGDPEAESLHLEGAANLLDAPEFASPGKMRALLRAIEEKGRLCRLLDGCLGAGGLQVLIGGELPDELRELGLVTAPFGCDGRVVGVVGVIGPMRMAYERVIPAVSGTAVSLSELLGAD